VLLGDRLEGVLERDRVVGCAQRRSTQSISLAGGDLVMGSLGLMPNASGVDRSWRTSWARSVEKSK
jgi:hypothetical protein